MVEISGLGVCFHLRRTKPFAIKELIISRRFEKAPRFWALRDVDLVCRQGQTIGIVGANGAGKSTLCLVLARILMPDEGRVDIHGRVSTLLGLRSALQQHLTGRENIFLFGALLGMSREEMESKVGEISRFSELDDFIDQPVRFYSSGMRSRLGFSVATNLEPEILILDEVLSVGDRSFRAKSRDRMLELMAKSKLIVIVSHSSAFLRTVCTHCLWLERGRARMYGDANDVLAAYETTMGGIDPLAQIDRP